METKFEDYWEEIRNEIISDLPSYKIPKEGIDYIEKCINYNIPGGKMNRGKSVLVSLQTILNRDLTEDETKKANILGWAIEWLQALFLVSDDLMDASITRRGHECWYRKEEVGLIAVNDTLILESCIYKLLKKYFRNEKYYIDLVELFHEVSYKTELGQLIDLITAPQNKVNLEKFSMDKYIWIVRYKTAFYSFYLPVALAMTMAGVSNEKSLKVAEDVLIPLGEYFQVQDDYLDCYGDPKVIGKIGTDIQDNKCSWLVNQVLKICTPEQKQILAENYGQDDPVKIQRVKDLYKELKIEELYKQYEEESYKNISDMISKVDPNVINPDVFTKFMNRIYKRTK
ncbi:farnesyl pyrophosphate synthase [Anaeromyces robustus]|jgi:farnesyl diphosphate synthase|uniref:Farnesyl pyrophosphate synthase n=1 Tax=Anaeromyces robustus TaxID=1754192 RepID=A0A1Y1WQQ2_9FUNG|nr:farnesyl pyrophosphate synthase [Anaeromyces robustus]|eukprot:ORX75850.1 farnesyl pyrophosphate synthase [Anaeromyces robustus]